MHLRTVLQFSITFENIKGAAEYIELDTLTQQHFFYR